MKLAALGSDHSPHYLNALPSSASSPIERATITIKLKSRPLSPASAPISEHLSHTEFAKYYGADPKVIADTAAYAVSRGLVVIDTSIEKRQVVVNGPLKALESAFEISFRKFVSPMGTFRGYINPLKVPDYLKDNVEAVLGLSNRAVAKPHFQMKKPSGSYRNLFRSTSFGPMSVSQVSKAYNFPTGDGKGQCIAIIELGGGYTMADMTTFFTMAGLKVPTIEDISILGAKNTTGSDADGEVELDIQIAGAVAPLSKIAVYFAPNTAQGFVQAITEAAHDPINKPSVISISWGGPENSWLPHEWAAMTNAIRDATKLGITVCCASGDAGSDDGVGDGKPHADFPASSPYALACGGTKLSLPHTNIVWNDASDSATGGGISVVYKIPDYQKNYQVPTLNGYTGRGVPDVAGNASPDSGYEVVVDGQPNIIGGTSAVAPLYSGLIAILNQQLNSRLGLFNLFLYGPGHKAFTQVSQPGNNGSYTADPSKPWNPCVGLGVVNGAELLNLLKKSKIPAGK